MSNQILNSQSSIERVVASGKRVFTTDDLAVIWGIGDRRRLIERIKYYVRVKKLTPIHKGVYAYAHAGYSELEVAQKLVPLSYVSLYTACQMHGLSFQYYSSVFSMALKSKTYEIDGQKYVYHKIKEPVFYSSLGLEQRHGYVVAGPERAICDTLYVFPAAGFDNVSGVDADLMRRISRIYGNKRLQKVVYQLASEIELERNND